MSSLFKEDDTIILNELNNQIPYTSISTSLEDPFGFSNPSENIETLTGYNRNFFSENRIQLFSIIYRDDLTT
ncbi:MAG: hypothetical protein PF518_00100, partial [Spirochaetaceae bacterium]|nr:hypothetical protein [Spirochaetaceae bacterium]